MKRLYRVKLTKESLEIHKAYESVGYIVNGYLAVNGVIQMYSLQEAKRKCFHWGAVPEKVEAPVLGAVTTVTMAQIDSNALVSGIEKALTGREVFIDADKNQKEKIYYGSVFTDLLSEHMDLKKGSISANNKKAIEQLRILASAIKTDYVQLIG